MYQKILRPTQAFQFQTEEIETKTIFKITKAGDQLLFSEDRIVYTKADYSDFDDFCLVNFSLEEKKLLKSKKSPLILKGNLQMGQLY